MLDHQKDSGLVIIRNIYYVLFCEMFFSLKIVLVLYFIKIKATCFDILKYVNVVSACLNCEH